jgi:hypothetical protein
MCELNILISYLTFFFTSKLRKYFVQMCCKGSIVILISVYAL